MALFTLSISTSPVSSLGRNLDVTNLNIGSFNILMSMTVYSLNGSGIRITANPCVAPYSPTFMIDNTTLVDPTPSGEGEGYFVVSDGMGAYTYTGGPLVGQTFSGTPAGLYIFLLTLIGTGVVLGTYITKIVSNLDSISYFNT